MVVALAVAVRAGALVIVTVVMFVACFVLLPSQVLTTFWTRARGDKQQATSAEEVSTSKDS